MGTSDGGDRFRPGVRAKEGMSQQPSAWIKPHRSKFRLSCVFSVVQAFALLADTGTAAECKGGNAMA